MRDGQVVDRAHVSLQEMVHHLVMLNVVSSNAAISACEMGKQLREPVR